MLFLGFGYRIHTAFMPGMAAGDTLKGEPETSHGTVFFQSLQRIAGTTRIETAMLSYKRAQDRLVELDQRDHDAAHFSTIFRQRCSREFKHCLFSAFTAPCLETTTTSSPASSAWFSLKLSRIRRLIRFLSTAWGLHFFETAKPSRAKSSWLDLASTRNNLSEERSPSLKTRR